MLIVGEENRVVAERARVQSDYAGWIVVRDVMKEEEEESEGEDEEDTKEERRRQAEIEDRDDERKASSSSSLRETKKSKKKGRKTGKKDGELQKKDKRNSSLASSPSSASVLNGSEPSVGVYRQMIFSCNPHAVQSEVKVSLFCSASVSRTIWTARELPSSMKNSVMFLGF